MRYYLLSIILLLCCSTIQAQHIEYKTDRKTNLITSITVRKDPTRMNWIIPADGSKYPWLNRKDEEWGAITNDIPQQDEDIRIETDVKRYTIERNLIEEYTIENLSNVPIDLSHIRICTPWNAHYLDIDTATAIRCKVDVHLMREGYDRTTIKATRINGKAPHVGLVVTHGDICSVTYGDCHNISPTSTCGLMYLSFEKVMLPPHKKYTLQWHIFSFKDEKDFLKHVKVIK